MVMKLDQLVNGAINVGFGAAAVAVEGGKKVLDDLGTKGEQVRKDAGTPDIARSVSDMFEQAGPLSPTMQGTPKRPSSSADGRFHYRLQQSRSLG